MKRRFQASGEGCEGGQELCVAEERGRVQILRYESRQRRATAAACAVEEEAFNQPSPISSPASLLDSSVLLRTCRENPDDPHTFESDPDSSLALSNTACFDLDEGYESDSDLQMPFPMPLERASSFDISSDFASDRQRMEGTVTSFGSVPSTPDQSFNHVEDVFAMCGFQDDSCAYERETLQVMNGVHPLSVQVSVCEVLQTATLPWVSGRGRTYREEGLDGDDVRSLQVPLPVWSRLYPHQKEGVMWLWKQACEAATERPAGGILGDEMGLGKTIQMLTFLSAALHCGYGRSALIVVPLSVIASWQSHQETWCPRLRLRTLTAETPISLRSCIIEGFMDPQSPSVLLTTYGMVQSMYKRRDEWLGRVKWDYVVLDEGHSIKNPASQTARAVGALQSEVRFVITGTPMQNSLDELWALFSFIDPRILAVTAAAFKRTYTDPIKKGMLKGSSEAAKEASDVQSEALHSVIMPYMLQRQKEDIPGLGLSKKIDVVVWCGMTDLQKRVYEGYLEGTDVRECILKKETAGAVCKLTNLRKLCNHLWLQYSQDELNNRLLVPTSDNEQGTIAGDCCKMEVLMKIYERARETGERVLVFSQSVKMLNIITVVLHECFPDIQLLRLDGSTKAKDRQERVDRFNTDASIDMMLLTTGVGGTGLTLTGASQVVIFDPDWNPAKDSQAIGRAHRIGQTRQVVVYRLMTCGGVEEFTYRQEIFKECVERKTTRTHMDLDMHRYFNRVELHSMFKFEPDAARTLDQLNTLQGVQQYPEETVRVFTELNDLENVQGITNHDAVFCRRESDSDVQDDLDATLPAAHTTTSVSSSQSPAPKRSALSDITPNMTPAAAPETLKVTDTSVERSSTPAATFPPALPPLPNCSPDSTGLNRRAPSYSSCGEMPRDKDDEGMLRAAEEALSRMSSPSPSCFPLGLPPRHASKSPGMRSVESKCSNCDYSQFPFCPVTGRAHKKCLLDSSERSDSVSSRLTPGGSPPVHPPSMEAVCVQTDDETSVDLLAPKVDHREGRALSFSSQSTAPAAPSAPLKTQSRSTVSVGSAQRELSFGLPRTSSASHDIAGPPDAPYKYREARSTISVGSAQRDLFFHDDQRFSCEHTTSASPMHAGLDYEVLSTHSVTLREVSFSSAPYAPCKYRETTSTVSAVGLPQRELSFGMSRSASGSSSTTVAGVEVRRFGSAPRELSMASSSLVGTPCMTQAVYGLGDARCESKESTSPPLQVLLNAPERPLRDSTEALGCNSGGASGSARRELSFGAVSHGCESLHTCRNHHSPLSWRNETPQGACTLQCGAPGAPCRGSVGSAFVSPVTNTNGIRRRARDTRCSDSETSDRVSSWGPSCYYDDVDFHMDRRSVSNSTEDSLRIRHSVNIYTPPPL